MPRFGDFKIGQSFDNKTRNQVAKIRRTKFPNARALYTNFFPINEKNIYIQFSHLIHINYRSLYRLVHVLSKPK